MAFVERVLPSHSFPRLLDLCCGPGRHAVALAHRGYRVLGVDANESAVRRARGGRRIRTTRSWSGRRHRVVLEYDGRVGDAFAWRLYAPAEFRALCGAVGLRTRVECAWFDESTPASPEHARMQFVVERA